VIRVYRNPAQERSENNSPFSHFPLDSPAEV